MSDLERAKKYLDRIPEELRGSPNDLVQLLAVMVAKVEKLTDVVDKTKAYIAQELASGFTATDMATLLSFINKWEAQAALKQEQR